MTLKLNSGGQVGSKQAKWGEWGVTIPWAEACVQYLLNRKNSGVAEIRKDYN